MDAKVAPVIEIGVEDEVLAQETWASDMKRKAEMNLQKSAQEEKTTTRQLFLNDPIKNSELKFSDNVMVTSKYTPLTFIPKNLFEQFRRLANIYFLTISCLQLFTNLSPTSKYTTVGPLAAVVAFSMLREGFEDLKRHRADKEVNGRKVLVLRTEHHVRQQHQASGSKVAPAPASLAAANAPKWVSVAWSDIVVGDIVQVQDRHEFPADLLLLSSSAERGMCYIETCNLDGETNLKIRSAVEACNTMLTPDDLVELQGIVEYELPNNRLYTFLGKLQFSKRPDPIPLDVENILLRGAILRNTKVAHGLVLYTGKESKQMMNSSVAPSKRSNVEVTVNSTLLLVLGLQLSLCAISTILMAVWVGNNRDVWYLPYVQSQTNGETAAGFLTFFILYNNFVPISLYVSMEFVKMFQAYLINEDGAMYHPETDTAALARTSNLNEELGQIEYIFSDKTGTLTRNEMEFRKCFIGGVVYGFGTTEIGLAAAKRAAGNNDSSILGGNTIDEVSTLADARLAQPNYDPKFNFDDPRLVQAIESGGSQSKAIKDFLTLLSVAHTVVPEADSKDALGISYQAESPDEAALVFAARCLGYFCCGKSASTVTVRIHNEGDKRFEILAVNKFNSTRKRMSVIMRDESGKVFLLCKGADNVMFERLTPGTDTDTLSKELAKFGTEGLRTLVLCSREISETELSGWMRRYQLALTALKDRDLELQNAAELIETNMTLVGATAIEDKLQIGVPDAIATLAKGNLKIWVLTGDKEETAINIGFACQLLTDEMDITIINAGEEAEVRGQINSAINKHTSHGPVTPEMSELIALVIDGRALTIVEDNPDIAAAFLQFAKISKAVIACRVSPKQKAEIVRMVRNSSSPSPMTLAIGDGANDVSMIQAAHVGIGISGNEGMQAVRSSDYAIAQFRFLKRLLLFHGRSNYRRISIVILYSFYKNCALVMALFFFCIFNGFSGTTLVDSVLSAGYNVVWTSLPIIFFGVMDRDVEIDTMLENPRLYMFGQLKRGFNQKTMAMWLLNAIMHACLLYMIPCYTLMGSRTAAQGELGTTVANILAIVVNLKLALQMRYWTKPHGGIVVLSILSFFLVVIFLSSINSFDLYFTGFVLYKNILFWLLLLLGTFMCIFLDILLIYFQREFMPIPDQIIQEQELLEKRRRADVA